MQMRDTNYIQLVKAILHLLDSLQKDGGRDGRISLGTAQRAANLTLILDGLVTEVNAVMLEEKILMLKAAEHELAEARRDARPRPELVYSVD